MHSSARAASGQGHVRAQGACSLMVFWTIRLDGLHACVLVGWCAPALVGRAARAWAGMWAMCCSSHAACGSWFWAPVWVARHGKAKGVQGQRARAQVSSVGVRNCCLWTWPRDMGWDIVVYERGPGTYGLGRREQQGLGCPSLPAPCADSKKQHQLPLLLRSSRGARASAAVHVLKQFWQAQPCPTTAGVGQEPSLQSTRCWLLHGWALR